MNAGNTAETRNDSAEEHRAAAVDWSCFSYLTVERSELYRSIIDVFAAAKEQFTLHLRCGEVLRGLTDLGLQVEYDETEAALRQLELWGNLQSYRDNAEVSSVADYYRKHLLYQLSAAGEAANAATRTFLQRLNQAAKLDTRALQRIVASSGQLRRLVETLRRDDSVDPVVLLNTLRTLHQDTDELTSRAQSFFRWLHNQTEAERGDLEAFLRYKQQLIDYLEQFVGELIRHGGLIADQLAGITAEELNRAAEIAAGEEVGAPDAALPESHETRLAEATRQWNLRMSGLRAWFVGGGGRPPQSFQLRSAARAAIPRLLQLAAQMNERQSGRSDRISDLRVLAATFLRCADDDEAHLLYRAAFALSPCRHLRIDEATLDRRDQHRESPKISWLEARPLEISPQLRASGRSPAGSAVKRVVDRRADRARLKRRLATEAKRDAGSREILIALGRRRLSELGELDRHAFGLLIELLEQTAARPGQIVSEDRPLVGRSRDGLLQIRLWPATQSVEGNGDHRKAAAVGIAHLRSADGTLSLPDSLMEVTARV